MIPYARQTIDEEDIKAVTEVLKGDYLTTGPKVAEFEQAFAAWVGAKYAVAVSSGTAALHLACLAAGINPGDEVIVTPMSFAASANCVLYAGARPVFADIESTGNIDPSQVEQAVTSSTKAVIPVHYGGLPFRMEEISRTAQKHGLTVVEDACHALGGEYRGSRIGSCRYSDMTVFSFHPVKHITTGEGGMITTNSQELYQKLVDLRSHGIVRELSRFEKESPGGWYYEMQDLGFNYRMSDIQAALGLSQLKKLPRFINRRRAIADRYSKSFKNLALELPGDTPEAKHAYHLYAVKVKAEAGIDRKKLYERLKEQGILAQVHYIPIHTMPYYRQNLGTGWGDCPVAEDHYHRVLSLPMYPGLTDDDVDRVIEAVTNAFRI
ncbi:MAG TPA: UDP-4-amino-4,6-dideoxy-N-acetyl-beta-L-altrosamine transaminase [Syntrophothermus lipocalidus]|nr:UDP-4-amino-4,6-dideoxy-N-acetyl-beta-L-altrosamine transaminase [Syntrophothermus lipocalidus]